MANHSSYKSTYLDGVFNLLVVFLIATIVYGVGAAETRISRNRVKTGIQEYCQFDYFNVSCASNEVILMKYAKYGRMKVGNCVVRDYGYIQCSTDIMNELDRRCSGRQACQFPIASLRDNVQPCPNDLTSYLEAEYVCVPVSTTDNLVCQNHLKSGSITLTAPSGYLSSIPMLHTGYGSRSCPLILTSSIGQSFNFTLFNFSPLDQYYIDEGRRAGSPSSLSSGHKYQCPYYAIIRDGGQHRTVNKSLCNGSGRMHNIYLSKHNIVTFYFSSAINVAGLQHALLKYEVVGCPQPIPPKGAVVSRANSRAQIKCNATGETWYLTCRGTSWVGTVSNCSQGSTMNNLISVGDNDPFPLGLLIAIAIGVILGIVIGLVMLVAVFHYRRGVRRRRLRSKANELMADDMSQENDENYARRLMQQDPGAGKRCPASMGEYTPMWELRRNVPRAANGIPINGASECTENPYGGTLSIATLPANCCNKSVTFTTFKPGENPYGTVSRYGPVGIGASPANGGAATMVRQQKNIINAGQPAPCLYEQGSELLYSTHSRSRPDILTDNNGSAVVLPSQEGDSSKLGHAHRSHSRDLCEQCVTSAENAGSSGVVSPPPPPPIGSEIVGSPTIPISGSASPPVAPGDGDCLPGNVMLSSPL